MGTDAAIDALWADKLPQDPAAALQTHMFRLRRGLPSGLIESVADGYRLDPGAVEVDADRLAEIVTYPGGDYPDTVKAPGVCAPVYEVDEQGRPLRALEII